jgi:hypothetical protein
MLVYQSRTKETLVLRDRLNTSDLVTETPGELVMIDSQKGTKQSKSKKEIAFYENRTHI